MNNYFILLDANKRPVAAGGYETIYADARLLFDNPRPRLVNRVEQSFMDPMNKDTIDRGKLTVEVIFDGNFLKKFLGHSQNVGLPRSRVSIRGGGAMSRNDEILIQIMKDGARGELDRRVVQQTKTTERLHDLRANELRIKASDGQTAFIKIVDNEDGSMDLMMVRPLKDPLPGETDCIMSMIRIGEKS